MTEYGITSEGFRRKTYDELYIEQTSFVRGRIDQKLTLSENTIEGAIITGACDELAAIWEGLEIAYNGINRRRAIGQQIVSIALLNGTVQRGASRGLVNETLTHRWPTGTTFAPGTLLISEEGNPTNSWTNRDNVTITSHTISAGVIVPQDTNAIFQSNLIGALAVGPSGTLTNIMENVEGLIAVTNALDATPGRDAESLEALRLRDELSIGRASTTTTNGIRAAVLDVDGVQYAICEENRLDTWYRDIPPHGFKVTLWDGLIQEADDLAICQAIYENLPPGTNCSGTYSQDITSDSGQIITVSFDRCGVIEAYITLTAYGSIGLDTLKTAIVVNAQPFPGDALHFSDIVSAVTSAGVDHCDIPLIGVTSTPTGYVSITPTNREIVLLDTSRITATVIA